MISRQNEFAVCRAADGRLFPWIDVPDGITIPLAVNLGVWLLRMAQAVSVSHEMVRAAQQKLQQCTVATGLWSLCVDDDSRVWLQADGEGLPRDSALELGVYLVSLDWPGALATGLVPGHTPVQKLNGKRKKGVVAWLKNLFASS